MLFISYLIENYLVNYSIVWKLAEDLFDFEENKITQKNMFAKISGERYIDLSSNHLNLGNQIKLGQNFSERMNKTKNNEKSNYIFKSF